MNKHLLTAAMAAAALSGTAAHAQSADFNDWVRAGDVLVAVGGPTGAILSTAAQLSGETTIGPNSALEFFELEPALSLAAGTLAADTYEGSGFAQSFTVATAGTTISFDWSLSALNGFDAGFADRAFVVVDGSTVLPLGTVAATTVTGSFSYTFNTTGSHAFAIVVMDVNDYIGVTMLGVEHLAVTTVPEPASWALMFGGLAAVGALARRRKAA